MGKQPMRAYFPFVSSLPFDEFLLRLLPLLSSPSLESKYILGVSSQVSAARLAFPVQSRYVLRTAVNDDAIPLVDARLLLPRVVASQCTEAKLWRSLDHYRGVRFFEELLTGTRTNCCNLPLCQRHSDTMIKARGATVQHCATHKPSALKLRTSKVKATGRERQEKL
ncbi:hypothetical protein BDW66DRAFT_6350 [Aspergillus desertorum]